MKIHLNTPDSPYFVRHYADGALTLNTGVHTESVLIHQDWLLPLPSVHAVDALPAELCLQSAQRQPQVLLIGTGKAHTFLTPEQLEILAPFIRQQIGIETMSTAAAARTYNVLSQEGRSVMAIFIV